MRVAQVWRYPVKSMQGEQLPALDISLPRIAFDREWGVRDSASGEVLTARRTPRLLHAAARLDGDGVVITLPDGRQLQEDGEHTDLALSAFVGQPVHLARAKRDERVEFEADQARWRSKVGSFNDGAEVHVLTTASLGSWDVRRFRPNLLIDAGTDAGFPEDDWSSIRIGDVELVVFKRSTRCSMTCRSQPGGIDEDPEILRSLTRNRRAKLGVYASVRAPGTVCVGDSVEVA